MTAKTEFLRKPKACVYHAYVIMYACDKIQKGVLIMKKTVLCLVLIICTLVLCACNAVEFELYFMVDGEVYGNVKTGGREMIRIPDDPVKEGYTFDGWYWDKDVWQRPFTANSLLDAPLSSNMSVYAKWTDNTAPDEDDTPPEAVHTCSLSYRAAVNATCQSEGTIEHYECIECHKKYSFVNPTVELAEVTVPKLSCDLTKHSAKEADCKNVGNIEFYECKVCRKRYTDAEATTLITNVLVPKTECSVVHRAAKETSCKEAGCIEHYECEVCHKTYTDASAETEVKNVTIAKLPCSQVYKAAVAATCQEEGSVAHYECEVCFTKYSVNNSDIKLTSVTVPKLTLTFFERVEPTCKTAGHVAYWGCSECSNKYEDEGATTLITDATLPKHTLVHNPRVEATAEKNGNVEYWYCGICEKAYSDSSANTVIQNTVLYYNWWGSITYEETNLRFKLTKNSNKEELPSGCERYLAGESDDAGNIDDMVDARNEAALRATKVTVTYSYFDDTTDYGWSKCIDKINQEVMSGSSSTPDIYCNFITDMVSSSLIGSFANLYSRERGVNYMTKEMGYLTAGYMSELMTSLTLDLDKMYLVASDYFIDLIRSFYVVPVNVKLYNQVASTVSGLENYVDDGVKDINDFFGEVKAGKWTYSRVADYSKTIYKNDSGETVANLGDTIGFALSSSSGLSASGMIYTSSVSVINRELDIGTGKYTYSYCQDGSELVSLTNALTDLFKSTGVISVSDQSGNRWGTTSLQAIRNQFARGKVLFGGVVTLGSLEYEEYQDMKTPSIGGFAIVPVPLFRAKNPDGSSERYMTSISSVGKVGAIANCTTKFSQCTAFIHYQSTHSTDILDEYWCYNLCYDIAYGVEGNLEMLQLIRQNVRNNFDSVIEDAIGFYYYDVDGQSLANRWHKLILSSGYTMTNMAEKYAALQKEKNDRLQELIREYKDLPN